MQKRKTGKHEVRKECMLGKMKKTPLKYIKALGGMEFL